MQPKLIQRDKNHPVKYSYYCWIIYMYAYIELHVNIFVNWKLVVSLNKRKWNILIGQIGFPYYYFVLRVNDSRDFYGLIVASTRNKSKQPDFWRVACSSFFWLILTRLGGYEELCVNITQCSTLHCSTSILSDWSLNTGKSVYNSQE